MEMQENETKYDGFVQFKTTKPRDLPPAFPDHFREQLKKIPLSTNAATQPKK
jgi:hypothetical protein